MENTLRAIFVAANRRARMGRRLGVAAETQDLLDAASEAAYEVFYRVFDRRFGRVYGAPWHG